MAIRELAQDEVEEAGRVPDSIDNGINSKLASEIRKELDKYGYTLEGNIEQAVALLDRHDSNIPDDPVVIAFVGRVLKDALKELLASQHEHFRNIVEKLLE